jgi:hypothetical protein
MWSQERAGGGAGLGEGEGEGSAAMAAWTMAVAASFLDFDASAGCWPCGRQRGGGGLPA